MTRRNDKSTKRAFFLRFTLPSEKDTLIEDSGSLSHQNVPISTFQERFTSFQNAKKTFAIRSTYVAREDFDPSRRLVLSLVLEAEHRVRIIEVVLHDAAPHELDRLVLKETQA